MVSDNPHSTQLETKDDIPLVDLFDIAMQKVDLFNEAERPFRNLFVQKVSEMIFSADHVPADMTWERVGEGEHPVTGDLPDDKKVAMTVEKYSRALNFSQESIEDNHHGRNPDWALCSSEFAAELVNELSWDASYNIPDASDLRSTALPENQIQIDGTTLFQTPWINDEGNSSYTFYMMDGSKPLYFHEASPIKLNGLNGAPVHSPGDLLGATGSARWGVKMIDPLAGVKVTADNLA